MPGRGPVPKDPASRARRNKDPIPRTEVALERARQPALPKSMPDGRVWPRRTRDWWRRWGRDPRAKRFDAAAWDELLDTAVVHAALWHGDWKAASELRLRTAKFGVTPEDRARMRISLSDGLEESPPSSSAENERGPTAKGAARSRYGELRVVGGASEVG